MRARRFSDCMHVRSTAVSEIRTLDMHARARFQRSNSVMHVFTVMHDQLCMMRALFNTSFTRILLALLLDLATAAQDPPGAEEGVFGRFLSDVYTFVWKTPRILYHRQPSPCS